MLRASIIVLVLAFLACRPGHGAPVKAFIAKDYDVAGQGEVNFFVELKALEPTKIATGPDLENYGVYVFDAEGNCIAWNDSFGKKIREELVFVPAEQARYLVQMRSFMPRGAGQKIHVEIR